MIGQTLGHYRIESQLGAGGMGIVYKARDTHLDRLVALKVLPPERVADPERKRRFIQEAKAASALNHPNIIHIYDIDTAAPQGHPVDFIVMEFVEGRTLHDCIGRKGLPIREAVKYAVQMADALAAAHAAGIIHRDVKPGNIMVTEKGLVKVLDFGLAKLSEPEEGDDAAPTQTMHRAAGVPGRHEDFHAVGDPAPGADAGKRDCGGSAAGSGKGDRVLPAEGPVAADAVAGGRAAAAGRGTGNETTGRGGGSNSAAELAAFHPAGDGLSGRRCGAGAGVAALERAGPLVIPAHAVHDRGW
jgi:serine/threonine protein kinase